MSITKNQEEVLQNKLVKMFKCPHLPFSFYYQVIAFMRLQVRNFHVRNFCIVFPLF